MLLSICVPVYNNSKLFEICLYSVAKAILGNEDRVEIIVSDNASEENIPQIIRIFKQDFTKIKIVYHINQLNIGLALNYINAVKYASGKYAWIIGSDDFVYPDGIKKILSVLDSSHEISFISLNLAVINLSDEVILGFDPKVNDIFRDFPNLITYKTQQIQLSEYLKVEDFVDPSFGTVMLGSMMASVFDRQIWNQFDFSNFNVNDKFDNLESIYPHILVFANQFLDKSAIFIDEPVILVGEGFRSWEDLDYKSGPLLYIYFIIFPDILKNYRLNGLKRLIQKKCKKYIFYTAGFFFIKLIYLKINRINKNDYILKISLFRVLWSNLMHFYFYWGLIAYSLKLVFTTIRSTIFKVKVYK